MRLSWFLLHENSLVAEGHACEANNSKLSMDGDEEDGCDYSDDFCEEEEAECAIMEEILSKSATRRLQIAMKEAKTLTVSKQSFSDTQTEITMKTRLAVVDWLFRIVIRVQFRRETLYNAIYLFDRLLALVNIPKDQVQLTSVTCLWISAKIEEPKNRDLPVFILICQNQYTAEQFLQKELEIVNHIGSRLNYPTPQIFMPSLLVDAGAKDCEEMCNFFLDLSLTVYDYMEIEAPLVAAVAVCVGMAASGQKCPLQKISIIIDIDDQSRFNTLACNLVKLSYTIIEKEIGGIFADYAGNNPKKLHEAVEKAAFVYKPSQDPCDA